MLAAWSDRFIMEVITLSAVAGLTTGRFAETEFDRKIPSSIRKLLATASALGKPLAIEEDGSCPIDFAPSLPVRLRHQPSRKRTCELPAALPIFSTPGRDEVSASPQRLCVDRRLPLLNQRLKTNWVE